MISAVGEASRRSRRAGKQAGCGKARSVQVQQNAHQQKKLAGGRWQVAGSVCMMAAGQRYRTCTGKGGSSRTSYLIEGML